MFNLKCKSIIEVNRIPHKKTQTEKKKKTIDRYVVNFVRAVGKYQHNHNII